MIFTLDLIHDSSLSEIAHITTHMIVISSTDIIKEFISA